MNRKTRALSCDDIRAIIRDHPTVFSALAGISVTTREEAASALTGLIMANPAIVDSVVTAGMELAPGAAARMGIFKWLAAADVLAQTAAADLPLLKVLFEELEPLCFGNGSLQ